MRYAEWLKLKKQVLRAEAADPLLRPLKDKIKEIADKLRHARETDVPALLREQNNVIKALITHNERK